MLHEEFSEGLHVAWREGQCAHTDGVQEQGQGTAQQLVVLGRLDLYGFEQFAVPADLEQVCEDRKYAVGHGATDLVQEKCHEIQICGAAHQTVQPQPRTQHSHNVPTLPKQLTCGHFPIPKHRQIPQLALTVDRTIGQIEQHLLP